MNPTEQTLRKLLSERVVLLDGAMGTMIQAHKLDEKAFLERVRPIWQKIARDLKAEDLLEEIVKAGR